MLLKVQLSGVTPELILTELPALLSKIALVPAVVGATVLPDQLVAVL